MNNGFTSSVEWTATAIASAYIKGTLRILWSLGLYILTSFQRIFIIILKCSAENCTLHKKFSLAPIPKLKRRHFIMSVSLRRGSSSHSLLSSTSSPRRSRRLVDISTFVSPRSSPILRRRSTSRLQLLPQRFGNSSEDLVNSYHLFRSLNSGNFWTKNEILYGWFQVGM